MKTLFLILALAFPFRPAPTAEEDPAHLELHALREKALGALAQSDLAAEVACLRPDAIVTWQNGEVTLGRDAARAFLERGLVGPEKFAEKFAAEVSVEEIRLLEDGKLALAVGAAQEHFTLSGGQQFDFAGRWSATLVKENGEWLIANLHSSENVFDNPMLSRLKAIIPWIGSGGLLVGSVGTWLMGLRSRRKG